jgi:hypothetical protein
MAQLTKPIAGDPNSAWCANDNVSSRPITDRNRLKIKYYFGAPTPPLNSL